MTTEDAVKKAIEGHYKLTGRAIGKGELLKDVEVMLEMGVPSKGFDKALEALKQAKRIREAKPDYYAPYGVEVNDGPFPTAKDIVPTPKRKKDGTERKS